MPPIKVQTPIADRISHGMSPRLLVLSNGHGEDQIALRLIQALRRRKPELEAFVLPLVGEGAAFAAAERSGTLRWHGPRQALPSGGFSNQSPAGLIRDLFAGLVPLSWAQWRLVNRWGHAGDPILAVGDLLPLLFAWAAGCQFGFIGTPKSDYTWTSASPSGWPRAPLADAYHRCKGSEWDPWEWALMGSCRCQLVAVRDRLTCRGLRRHGIRAIAPGNPMMDEMDAMPLPNSLVGRRQLLLLAGSRMPEALRNFQSLLGAVMKMAANPSQSDQGFNVLVATGTEPRVEQLEAVLQYQSFVVAALPQGSGATACWQLGNLEVLLGPGCFARWANWAELGIATAGTATEQLVGLGVPALSLPSVGPQFKVGFACRQSRLLGGAVHPCQTASSMATALANLLRNDVERSRLGRIGRRRMGPSGGSDRLAALIQRSLLQNGVRG